METTSSTTLPPPRAHRFSYTHSRVPSRSNTISAFDARMAAPNVVDRRQSNLTPSPQPQLQQQEPHEHSPYLTHRFQKSTSRPCHSPSSTESPRFRPPPREICEEPKLSATSTYLQEKLLRERKVESERSASRMSNDRTPSSVDLRASQSSPARPRSSTGNGDPVKKKGGVSLKEMEQTLTTLHKQNFDLKLELYHRREKQTSLEEKCESLDREKQEAEAMNDKLLSELEMRDKAVEEAVSMIITLEARLEQLLREREMVQQVEKHNLFASNSSIRRALSSASRHVATDVLGPMDHALKPKQKYDEGRTLARMPSFLSERSENTENLRNVYLGSVISLPRMSEDNLDSDFPDLANRIGSPSLSVLSESSFLSIYGRKNDSRMTSFTAAMQQSSMSSVPADILRKAPELAQEVSTPVAATHAVAGTMLHEAAPSEATPRKKRSNSPTRTNNGAAGLNILTEFIGTNSPLQRLEKMEISLQAMDDASQPSSDDGRGQQVESLANQLRARDFGKSSSKEKRDLLRRVRTDAPFAGVGNPHNLPPTPDTISTSTLRRYKNSNDTLSQEKGGFNNETSYLASSESTAAGRASEGVQQRADLQERNRAAPQPSSTSAFNSRRYEMGIQNGYFDSRHQIPPRPRSADETTLSHYDRGSVWGDSESSDGDMDIDGNDSASMQDCWLRESLRPAHLSPRTRKSGRASPDLFHFPSTVNGWSTTEMFGKSGQGYPGPAGAGSAPYFSALDKLGASLPVPASGVFGAGGLLASPLPYDMGSIPGGPPPPPNRRSSLHAQTGSTRDISSRCGSRAGSAGPGTPNMSMSNARTRRSPTRMSVVGGDGDGDGLTTAAHDNVPEKQAQSQSAAQPEELAVAAKSRHYPPASGPAPRNRVLSLFRRSGSHEPSASPGAPVAPASAPASETTFPAMGMPSRVRKGEMEEEGGRSSATPPPILRNARGAARSNSEAGQETVAETAAIAANKDAPSAQAASTASALAHEPQAAQDDANGAAGAPPRKKWLGLGRVANLRTRTG